MKKILQQIFFDRPTLIIAQELLGKFLVRKSGKKEIAGMITETEAYIGLEDKASHASRGRTKRTEVMFGNPGYWYVYLVYGMYNCLNIVTERERYPAAILIRSVCLLPFHYDRQNMAVNGPGRVCKYFQVDKRFNKRPAELKTGLWIEDRGVRLNPKKIKKGKRVGVDYARSWKNKHWRFYLE